MPYPNRHLYLTWHWNMGSSLDEAGQVGLRFDSLLDASAALVAACSAAVSNFWTAGNSGIESGYKLSFLRLASIGVDGRYMPDSVAHDHVYPTPISGGGGTTTARFPLQMSLVSTLVTAKPRGRASKGRIYLPWWNNALDATYRWPASNVNLRSGTLAGCIDQLNIALGAPATVFSRVGSGNKERITGVSHGTRPDVQRRRAEQLPDPRGPVTAIPAI